MMTLGWNSISTLSNAKSRSISAENPNGEKGGAARAVPDKSGPASELGRGWKVRPCIHLKANSLNVLAEIKGPGVIRHIWLTTFVSAYRGCILRFYWDGEEEPSVEVPLGDFFACGHARHYDVDSLPIIAVNPQAGFNCYWPMPFKKSCTITVENQTAETIPQLFYQIDYTLGEVPENEGYFHAQWRRSRSDPANPIHTILDGVRGQGHYVGTFLAWAQMSQGWWGEGETKFYIDGDDTYPTICATGVEDYAGGAWAFQGKTFSKAYAGYALNWIDEDSVPKHTLYRWHIPDPIRFKTDLRVTIQTLGFPAKGKFVPLADDISSTAYWYQAEPHGGFSDMLSLAGRDPYNHEYNPII